MDNGFYNLNNEYITPDSIKETLIGYYQEAHANDRTKIDDFNEGSEIMNLIGLMSVIAYNMLYEQNQTLSNHFVNTAEDEYLDLIGANPNINLEREMGANATGFVKFTVAEPAMTEIEIPEGTVVSNADASYSTIGDNYISIGETYTYCQVECDVEGTVGNCVIGAITECEDPQFTVTNDEAFIDGAEFEDDEDYRTRLLEFLREPNFGSLGYYEGVLMNFPVHDILHVDDEDAIVYLLNIIDNEESVFNEILAHFNDANNFVLGHAFEFDLADHVTVGCTVTVNGSCNYSENDIKEICSKYFTGGSLTNYPLDIMGFNIGETTTKADLIAYVQGVFPEITSMSISNITLNSVASSDFDDVSSSIEDTFGYRAGTFTVVFA